MINFILHKIYYHIVGAILLKKSISVMLCFALIFSPDLICKALGVSAQSAILMEGTAGNVIYGKNENAKLPMASTTKIMTALCAIENSEPNELVAVNPAAIGIEGSSIYLKKGEKLTMRELLLGLMLNSGNDAAVAIAYAVSGSVDDFAKLMNKTAEKIGVKNTHFSNPSGLDDSEHYTTAYDLAKITAYALKNKEFKNIVSTYRNTISDTVSGQQRYLKNHNKLLKMYDGCIGVKTGFTKKSGRCLVSAAERNGVMLVAVTLNAPDDWNDHINMLNYGFEKVTLQNVFKKDDYVCTLNVNNGSERSVKAIFENDVSLPQISGSENNVTIKYKIPSSVTAPIKYHQSLGRIDVYLNGKYLLYANVVASSAVSANNTKTLKRSVMLLLCDFALEMTNFPRR